MVRDENESTRLKLRQRMRELEQNWLQQEENYRANQEGRPARFLKTRAAAKQMTLDDHVAFFFVESNRLAGTQGKEN